MADVLILGKLGDMCRKLVELERLKEEQPTNKLIDLDLTAFKEVVEGWPTEHKDTVQLKLSALRIKLDKLANTERDLREVTSDQEIDNVDAGMYFSLLATTREYLLQIHLCRELVGELNALGGMGLVPGNQATESLVEKTNE